MASNSKFQTMVVRHLLDMYVNHLRSSAPPGWSARQINFQLFEESPRTTTLTKELRVTDGLKALTLRKTIPRIDPRNRISAGMIRAELTPQFTGGLRILYHPLASLLQMPTSLLEIYELLAPCSYAGCLSFLECTPSSVIHRTSDIRRELKSFFSAMHSCPGDLKDKAFYDFKAIALGMCLEARHFGDKDRQEAWGQVFLNDSLNFASHPGLASKSATALDSLMRRSLFRSIEYSSSRAESQLAYLKKYVFKNGTCRLTEMGIFGSDLIVNELDVNGLDIKDVHKIHKAILGLF
jgi:hypothetical protein